MIIGGEKGQNLGAFHMVLDKIHFSFVITNFEKIMYLRKSWII